MKKPSVKIRKAYYTDYNDGSVFAANARLLQSVWRENAGIKLNRRYGNFLDEAQAYEKELNFLSPIIREVVKKELEANEIRRGAEKRVIKKDRMYENLLASQPLAFNLFSELRANDFKEITRVFKKFYGDKIKRITAVDFEISPGRRDQKFTGDRSAFDVFLEYEGKVGKGFIGIEIKYAETLKDKPASFKDRYKEVADLSGKFSTEGIKALVGMPSPYEQVWRDHLLSLSMLPPINSLYDEGFFVYLFPKDNENCIEALDGYNKFLKDTNPENSGIHRLYMEDLIRELKEVSNAKWIRDFEDRYLDFSKLENL